MMFLKTNKGKIELVCFEMIVDFFCNFPPIKKLKNQQIMFQYTYDQP